MSEKEKFLKLVSEDKTDTLQKNRERIRKRAILRESQNIALKVLLRLRELKCTQKDLAVKMGVSPQQVNKIVSGKENLTLDTLVRLQEILDIPLLASYNEDVSADTEEQILTYTYTDRYAVMDINQIYQYGPAKTIKAKCNQQSQEYCCEDSV